MSRISFIYLFSDALGLCSSAKAFSSCGVRASHRGGLSCCGAQALGAQAQCL